MAKIIYLNFGQSISTKENIKNVQELKLKKLKQQYKKQYAGRDTLKNFEEFVFKNCTEIEQAYQMFGY